MKYKTVIEMQSCDWALTRNMHVIKRLGVQHILFRTTPAPKKLRSVHCRWNSKINKKPTDTLRNPNRLKNLFVVSQTKVQKYWN